MKNVLIILMLLVLSSCGFISTGQGVYSGRVVDVSWEGIIFKSCEVRFQLGEQSSTSSFGSTSDKEFCDKLASQVGQVVSVKYIHYPGCCLRTGTRDIIYY